MPALIRIHAHANGPRLYVGGQRVHHGATGCVLVAFGRRHRALLVAALALIAHDAHDWRAWFARESWRESTLDKQISAQ